MSPWRVLWRDIGLKPIGGNYHTCNAAIRRLGLNTSHFTGQLWNKGKHVICNPAKPLEELLQLGTSITSDKLRKRLFKEGLRQELCSICGITDWLGDRLSLELDHINGDKFDNRLVNLRILCPNCHSQTPTYRGIEIKTKCPLTLIGNENRLKPDTMWVRPPTVGTLGNGSLVLIEAHEREALKASGQYR